MCRKIERTRVKKFVDFYYRNYSTSLYVSLLTVFTFIVLIYNILFRGH